MEYEKDYLDFAKSITDKYISLLNGDCPANTWSGNLFCDDQYILPTEQEENKFHKERNERAIEWLNKNMLSYKEWKNCKIT